MVAGDHALPGRRIYYLEHPEVRSLSEPLHGVDWDGGSGDDPGLRT